MAANPPVNRVLQVYSIILSGTGETVTEKHIIINALRLNEAKFAVSQLKLKPERALKTPGTCTSPAASSRTSLTALLQGSWENLPLPPFCRSLN